jgi:hypothetical protein
MHLSVEALYSRVRFLDSEGIYNTTYRHKHNTHAHLTDLQIEAMCSPVCLAIHKIFAMTHRVTHIQTQKYTKHCWWRFHKAGRVCLLIHKHTRTYPVSVRAGFTHQDTRCRLTKCLNYCAYWNRVCTIWIWILQKVKVVLTTDGQSDGLSWCQAQDQIFFTVRQLRICWCGAPSRTRGRVCLSQLLLALASADILGSESCWTHDHIVTF